ncbi:MAG: SMP-30/gluconolactonase/LRE family protein [Granulosicoccus sp.]
MALAWHVEGACTGKSHQYAMSFCTGYLACTEEKAMQTTLRAIAWFRPILVSVCRYTRLWGSGSISDSASERSDVIPEKSPAETVNGCVGTALHRPECVLAHESGLILVPSWSGKGGISLITPDNQTHHILTSSPLTLRPNGIALEPGGSVLLAHLGDETGGIYRLFPDGRAEPYIMTVNGEPMPPANFVVRDSLGRLWITVSTRKIPRALDYRADASTGFIAVALPGEREATIVADRLGYANECVIDEANSRVYVNETFGRRLSRFDMRGEQLPLLTNKHCIHDFTHGSYPDGLALDEAGCLWVTSIISNRILRIEPDGKQRICFEDSSDSHLQWTEAAYTQNELGREHLDRAHSRSMKNISNVAFGGPDRKRLYIGNLLGDTVPFLDVDTAGAVMPHWDTPLGPLANYIDGAEKP